MDSLAKNLAGHRSARIGPAFGNQHAFNFECRIKSPAVRQHKGPFPHSLIGFIDSQIHQALLLDAYGPSTLEYAEISFLSDWNQEFHVVPCCNRVDSMPV